MTFLFLIWPQQLLPLLPEWLLLIRPQELPWWPPLTSGVLVHYWELPSYYIYTPDHTNLFNSTNFTLSFTNLAHLFGRVLKCPACECLGFKSPQKIKGHPYSNPWGSLLAIESYPHTTSTHKITPIPSAQITFYIIIWNHDSIIQECVEVVIHVECLEVRFNRANKKGILFTTLISGILVSFWSYPHTTSTNHMIPIPFNSTAFTLSFRNKSHLFKRALRSSFMRLFRGSSNHSKSKGILLQTIQLSKLFLEGCGHALPDLIIR